MARAPARYACAACGAAYPKWSGRCDACGGWNTIAEDEGAAGAAPGGLGAGKGNRISFADLSGAGRAAPRRLTGIDEFDRAVGGGLVPGSAVLIGGDPGIGKSTLLLQIVAAMAAEVSCVYISGEEAVDQVRLRAARLGLGSAPVRLASVTSVRDIVTSLDTGDGPGIVVIDSIQTMHVDSLDSALGTVAQLRASASELIRLAKRRGFTVVLVGHVTKEGTIAGPRALEHMVDTVLYFEGDRGHQYRMLRTTKNRFGPSEEIGVFEMTDGGLREVHNPSALFLAGRRECVSGSVVFAGIEGTRPLLVEIQALVAPSPLATPRRAVVGWDSARLSMVLAILDARCGVALAGRDVYLNVAGGLRITEPAADLAVAGALVSAAANRPAPENTVVFGEIGLSAEVRGIGRSALRLKEAAKLGFKRAIAPRRPGGDGPSAAGIELCEIERLSDLLALFDWRGDSAGGDVPPGAES